ncbi:MAG: acyltransferase [Clostridium sp.]|jgi:surface polysaccharide O-acyltransferase-like enzyme|nr:acyltransferase [Clostridium sp.]
MREPQEKKKKIPGIELLRILAMMMVVTLHYLGKGEILPSMAGEISAVGLWAWVLETLSIVAVNTYMLISGFFLAESSFRCGRLIQLLCQVLFYSLLVPVLLMAAGVLDIREITVYQWLRYILPTQMAQYWFVTAYVTMYLFSPLLNAAVRYMKQSQLRLVLILLLLFFSVNKSVLPIRLEMDNLGYDGLWFFCVYLCAAYLRRYGVRFFAGKPKRGFVCYFASCGGILGLALASRLVYLKTGRLESVLAATYHYNHILNLCGAVSLFYAFSQWKLREGRVSGWIRRIAPYTFGVYLLHEQLEIRYLWPRWLGAGRTGLEGNAAAFLWRCLVAVLSVFTVGIFVDWLRGKLFSWAAGLWKESRAERLLEKIDGLLAEPEIK